MAAVSVEKLRGVVTKAMQDEVYAEKLFNDPDTVATEHGLSADETLVIKQMSREQFEEARKDATAYSELTDDDLDSVAGGAGSSTPNIAGTATNMVIGRSISLATGTSYQKLTSAACDCCGWKSGISGGGMVSLPS